MNVSSNTFLSLAKIIIIVVVSFQKITGVAQSKRSFGPFVSFPIGDFRSANLGKGGFAKPGWGIAYEEEDRFESWPKGLFFNIHFSYQQNNLDKDKIAQAFTDELGYTTTVNKASYKPTVLTAGGSYEWILKEKYRLSFKGRMGAMFSNIDPFVITVKDNQNNVLLNDVFSFRSVPSFAYCLGAEAAFPIIEILDLCVFIDYTAGKGHVNSTLGKVEVTNSQFNIAYVNAGLSLQLDLK